MAKKDKDMFKGYGSDSSVVLEQKPFTIEDLEESIKKASNMSSSFPPILMSPNNFMDFQKILNPEYYKEHEKKCSRFETLFHKGVVFQHQGSKVCWEVVTTFKHSGTGEVRCRIKSCTGSGKTKELCREKYNDYILHSAPDAVTVLFGPKDE